MAKKKTITMQEVAEEVGVSVATVSRVFNDAEFASEHTRDRIAEAVDKLGYSRTPRRRTSSSARPLGQNQSGSGWNTEHNVILMAGEELLNDLDSPGWLYRDIVPALQRIGQKNGVRVVFSLCSTKDGEMPFEAGNEQHLDGVLWMGHGQHDLLRKISEKVPVVVINDDSFFWPPQASVLCNNKMVLFQAVEHLVELGHKQIAYFAQQFVPNSFSTHLLQRQEAFKEAMLHFGLNPALCILPKFGINEHNQAVAETLDSMDDMESRPTALITELLYATQFIKEARQRSMSIPKDLSIVAIDNAAVAEMIDPPLTAVDCRLGRCAEVAFELLLQNKNAHQRCARTILLEPKLIVRNSTSRLDA